MAYGIHGSAHRKKISGAWKKSEAAIQRTEEEIAQRNDPFNNAEKEGEDGNYLITRYFGDALLYACYEFYDRFKHKPANWLELFDFLRFVKVKSIQRELALATARTG
jgi:hypothetical protein